MNDNYYFIDGSALIAQIQKLQKVRSEFAGRKLEPIKFIQNFQYRLTELGSANFKRATYFFPKGDQQKEAFISFPNLSVPGTVRDIQFKDCGKKMPHSQGYETFLAGVPEKWRDRCAKSEKGIDIEMCCDALRLALAGKLERLFVLTNDSDFLPLFKILGEVGTNVSLIHLSKTTSVNKELLSLCDSYDVVPSEQLDGVFEAAPTPPTPPTPVTPVQPEVAVVETPIAGAGSM